MASVAAIAGVEVPPEHYIGGRRVPSSDTFLDRSPIDESELAAVARGGEDEVDAAVRAAKGWGGDRYVAWRDGDRSCVRMDFVMDSPKETDELVKSLREWAAARKGSATAAGPSLTTCG